MSRLLTHRFAATALTSTSHCYVRKARAARQPKYFTRRYLEGVLFLQGLSDLRLNFVGTICDPRIKTVALPADH